MPLSSLLPAVAFGLYPLVRTGLVDLVREHKTGTELFVTVATLIALIGCEYVAAAVLMDIILIAELSELAWITQVSRRARMSIPKNG